MKQLKKNIINNQQLPINSSMTASKQHHEKNDTFMPPPPRRAPSNSSSKNSHNHNGNDDNNNNSNMNHPISPNVMIEVNFSYYENVLQQQFFSNKLVNRQYRNVNTMSLMDSDNEDDNAPNVFNSHNIKTESIH